MKIRWSNLLLPGLLAVLGAWLIVAWLGTGSLGNLQIRVPGMDLPAGGSGSSQEALPPPVAGKTIRGDGQPADLAGSWPWFRGPRHDGICHDMFRLARSWPESGPALLWTVEMGEGYASPAIHDGCAYVLDYDEQAKADTMRCLSLADGREVWRNSYPILVTRNHGMSRTVPAIIDDCVISLGPRCHVACWDTKTGDCRWLVDLAGQYGATVPRWYAGQCPLIDRQQLVLAPCGESMLIALDPKTGSLLWKSPNPRGWRMTHASIVPMEFQGRRTYVYCGSGGVAGIDAEDGTLLWDSTAWPEQFATSPSPVPLPDGRIFLSSGYNSKVGSLMLQLRKKVSGTFSPQTVRKKENESFSEKRFLAPFSAEVAFRLTPKQFNSEQQTPIYFDGHLFAVRKRGGGQLVCMDLAGDELWNSGSDRFGHGPYMIADGLILAMDNRGKLTMAEATSAHYRRLGQWTVFQDGHDAWGPMALADGRLIVRDMTRMACLDIGAKSDK